MRTLNTLAENSHLNSISAVSATITCFTMGALLFLLMPVYLGALADSYGFDYKQVGWLASLELLGQAMSACSAMFWVRKVSWRKVIALSGMLLIVVNLLSIYVGGSYPWLLLVRWVSGVAVGCVLSVGCTALGDTLRVDRNFAFLIAVEMLVQSMLFACLPAYISAHGVKVFYLVLAVSAVIILLMAFFIASNGSEDNQGTGGRVSNLRLASISLAATILFFIGIMMVFSFVERLGVFRGLSAEDIGLALSISTFFSITGALAASVLGDHLGRLLPMVIALFGLVLAIGVLLMPLAFWGYFTGLSLMLVCWNFWVPYQMSTVAIIDPSGRYVVLIPMAQSLGVSVAPALAGQILGHSNYVGVLMAGTFFLVASLGLFTATLKDDQRINSAGV